MAGDLVLRAVEEVEPLAWRALPPAAAVPVLALGVSWTTAFTFFWTVLPFAPWTRFAFFATAGGFACVLFFFLALEAASARSAIPTFMTVHD